MRIKPNIVHVEEVKTEEDELKRDKQAFLLTVRNLKESEGERDRLPQQSIL